MKIELEFEVWKILQAQRKSEGDTENDVIRRLLQLPPKPQEERPWSTKRGTFHHGTPFRAKYKGREYFAQVVDGALVFEDERFNTPSAAARKITGSQVNGYEFWEYQYQGDDHQWHKISEN